MAFGFGHGFGITRPPAQAGGSGPPPPYDFTVDNEAARLALQDVVFTPIGSKVLQVDTGQIWELLYFNFLEVVAVSGSGRPDLDGLYTYRGQAGGSLNSLHNLELELTSETIWAISALNAPGAHEMYDGIGGVVYTIASPSDNPWDGAWISVDSANDPPPVVAVTNLSLPGEWQLVG